MLFPYRRLAVALFASSALANPVPTEEVDQCATIDCRSGLVCKVVDERAVCIPTEIQECGPKTCAEGEVCCNDSCGICTPPGGMCTLQLCPPTGPECGTERCYEGQECCNASCGVCTKPGGMCPAIVCEPEPEPVECGPNTCATGEECCNESCGICAKPGEGCTEQLCMPERRADSEYEAEPEQPVQCGRNTCPKGEVCCNESCGTCAAPDGACTLQFCFPEEDAELGSQCGPNTCAAGEECCNSSCGYCVKPGEGCTKELCPAHAEGEECGPNFCGAGEECCNSSCGYCTKPGEGCTKEFCDFDKI